jgi:hypothetical protein
MIATTAAHRENDTPAAAGAKPMARPTALSHIQPDSSSKEVQARPAPCFVRTKPTGESSRSSATHVLHLRGRELVVTGYWRTACRLGDMGISGVPDYRARRRAREQPRQHLQHTPVERPRSDRAAPAADGPERRTAATTCGWCGGPITPRSRGPIPKWCSATCRHRAWEQRRAATSGRTAVQVVERQVEIHVPLEPTRRDWPRLLGELAGQLDDGRVYDRDLPGLSRALEPVLRSYLRRARWSGSPDVPRVP